MNINLAASNNEIELDMMARIFNLSTGETKEGGQLVLGQPRVYSEFSPHCTELEF